MIIQVAGTNGAGKSVAVGAVLDRGKVVQEDPDGLELRLPGVDQPVWVPGGRRGCDGLNNVFDIHGQVRRGLALCPHVLWEGGTSHGGLNQTRGPQLVEELGVSYVVVLLTAPYGACLDGINTRRASVGRPPFLDDKDVRANYKRAQHYAARMRDAGARVVRASRGDAPAKIIELLRGT